MITPQNIAALNEDGFGDGWYVVPYYNGGISFDERLNVTGNARIVLDKLSRLTLTKGISVPSEMSLTIYTGNKDEYLRGVLIADASGEYGCAGIGGNNDGNDAGSIAIYGGEITAKGGNYAAGIGGGNRNTGSWGGGAGTIVVGDGVIAAQGGYGGAGIGGGANGYGGTVTISGGTVTATARSYTTTSSSMGGKNFGDGGAGIGSGRDSYGCQVIITGGTVVAEGSALTYDEPHRSTDHPEYDYRSVRTNCSASIGYGYHATAKGEVKIEGGNITAYAFGKDGYAVGNSAYKEGGGLACDVALYTTAKVALNGAAVEKSNSVDMRMAALCTTTCDSRNVVMLAVNISPCDHSSAIKRGLSDKCSVTCPYCAYSEEHGADAHTFEYKHDDAQHWQVCTLGGYMLNNQKYDHVYDAGTGMCACGAQGMKVEFSAGAGTGSKDPLWVSKGEYTLPDSTGFTAPSGLEFRGWYVNGDTRQVYAAGSSITITADTTLTAVWSGSWAELQNQINNPPEIVSGTDGGASIDNPASESATLTVGSSDVQVKATFAPIAATGMRLSSHEYEINEGESKTLVIPIFIPGNVRGWVTMQSSDTSIAEVDSNGKVTARKPGTVTITATTAKNATTLTATCTVTVNHVHSLTKVEKKAATCDTAGNTEYWTCDECGKLFSDKDGTTETSQAATVIAALGHDIDDHDFYHPEDDDYEQDWYPKSYVEAKAATCTEAGNITYWVCLRCNKYFADPVGMRQLSKAEVLIPAGHTLVHVEGKDATCTKDGNLEHWKCTTCGKLFRDSAGTTQISTADVTIPAAHTPGELKTENIKIPTCTKSGSYDLVGYCTVCEKELTRLHQTSAPLGHDWNEGVVTKAATCTEDGETTYTCKREGCGQTKKEAILATGHKWGAWTTTTEATQDAPGVETRTCENNSSHTETRTIPAGNHTHHLTHVEVKAATCTEAGNIEYWVCDQESDACHRCYSDANGTQSIDDTVVIPAAHTWDEGTVITPVGCTTEGEMKYTCSKCNATKTEVIKPQGHPLAAFADKYEVITPASCAYGGYQYKVHYCTACGEVQHSQLMRIAALGHDWGAWTQTKAPTCTEAGEEQRVCANDATHVEARTVEATGHTPASAVHEHEVAATCTESGSYDEVVYCADCKTELSREKKTVAALGHDWDSGVVTKEPTATEPGVRTYTCKNDPQHTRTEEIPAKGADPQPDESQPSVAALAMYRLYNQWSGEHFYTSDDEEFEGLVALGWTDEGTGWKAPETSNTPVYRLYNPYAGEHHYTMDANEKDAIVAAGWTDEGIGWYSDDDKTVPLFREYNPNEFANNHNYTTDKAEHDGLVALGWLDEGYAWYGLK